MKSDLLQGHILEAYVKERFPTKDPLWSPNGQLQAIQDHQHLVQAVCATGKPAVNMSKPSLVMQEATESPEAFYTFIAFISQITPDIRKKLQRLEEALGKPMS